MYFLLSGEGATDMGKGSFDDRLCECNHYDHGPMALLVDRLVTGIHGTSFIGDQRCGFIPKKALLTKVKPAKPGKRGMILPGKNSGKDTGYFYRAARSIALWAKEVQKEKDEVVVAVLFRNSDNRATSERGAWTDKWRSMEKGFAVEAFGNGVPMLPKPTSEAWLLCALKEKNPYQNCTSLKNRSSNPKAKKPLKKELSDACGGKSSRSDLCALVENGQVDACKINMPSYNAFRERLLEAIK